MRQEILVLSVVVCLAVVVMFPTKSYGVAYCNQHQCGSGKCLPHQWVCDGDFDCDDGSDESNCGKNKTCHVDADEPDQRDFLCGDQIHCVPARWVCDGEFDCPDRSDEADCFNKKCGSKYFSCGRGLPCVHETFVCDGHSDCSNGADELPTTCANKTCETTDFRCVSGHQCVNLRWRCDGDSDCMDGSDERNCSTVTCSPGQFKCNDTQCIPNEWHCDGKFDCADSSDELACTKSSEPEPTHCTPGDFMCRLSGECMSEMWKCDGDMDCEDGSDELNCAAPTCRPGEYQCREGGNCIPGSWKCDGIIQCEGGSDEADCFNRACNNVTEFDCNSQHGSSSMLQGHNCIPIEKVCDHWPDCGRSEDEQPAICQRNISSTCADNNGLCQHKCAQRLGTTYCLCNDGYQLVSDGRSCRDIDECREEERHCSQICENTKGSFKCHCKDGYELDIQNHIGCHAKGEEPMLIFSNRHDIRDLRVRSLNYRPMIEGLRSARALDYDMRTKTVFWSDASWKNISRALMSEDLRTVLKQEVIVSGVSNPEGLAYDWIHSNLYWTDSSLRRIEVVYVGNVSEGTARWRHTLHKELDSPKAIVIDPRENRRHLYWTECGKTAQIMRSSLDGSNKIAVIPAGRSIILPLGLALDLESDTLFWVDAKLHLLQALNLSSRTSHIVFTSSLYLRHPYSLTVFEDYVYWTDWQTGSILKRNKFNRSVTANITKVAELLSSPTDIRVYHELTQPLSENSCSHNKCSHLCLPNSEGAYRCVCPTTDQMSYTLVAGTTCVAAASTFTTPQYTPIAKVTETSIAVNGSLSGEASNKTVVESSSVAGVVLGLLGALLFILLLVFGYVILRRYRRRNRKTMNFDNPMYRKRSGDEFSIDNNFQPIDSRISQQLIEPLAQSSTGHLATINS